MTFFVDKVQRREEEQVQDLIPRIIKTIIIYIGKKNATECNAKM